MTKTCDTLLLLTCLTFALARGFLPHRSPTAAGTYEALAHVLAGLLIGLYAARWLGAGRRFHLYCVIGISAAELFYFLTRM
jgi:hypothetical protein